MNLLRQNSRWLAAHTLAILFSLAHLILDWQFGLLGPPGIPIPPAQTILLAVSAGMYAL